MTLAHHEALNDLAAIGRELDRLGAPTTQPSGYGYSPLGRLRVLTRDIIGQRANEAWVLSEQRAACAEAVLRYVASADEGETIGSIKVYDVIGRCRGYLPEVARSLFDAPRDRLPPQPGATPGERDSADRPEAPGETVVASSCGACSAMRELLIECAEALELEGVGCGGSRECGDDPCTACRARSLSWGYSR